MASAARSWAMADAQEPEAIAPDPLLARTLSGRYQVERLLGEGGLGCVYVARHLTLGRNVAIKVLHEEFQSNLKLRQRFAREAQALSALSHPNIVTVTDFGADGETLYIAMELLEGLPLNVLLGQEKLEPLRAIQLFRQILRGLSYAHAQGIAHRDLKPANVFIRHLHDGTEHVEVLDFGLAKFVDESVGEAGLTKTGMIMGTPAYMAPEQAGGGAADARADVYAAGLILFEMLTGARPFPYKSAPDLLRAHLIEPVPRIREAYPALCAPDAIDAFIARCLTKSAAERFPNGGAMLEALDGAPAPPWADESGDGTHVEPVSGANRPSAPDAPPSPRRRSIGAAFATRPPAGSSRPESEEPADSLPARPRDVAAAVPRALFGVSVSEESARPQEDAAPRASAGASRSTPLPIWAIAVAGGAILLVAAVALIATLGVYSMRETHHPAATATAGSRQPEIPRGVAPPPEPSVQEAPPWAAGVPSELASLHDQITRGREPARSRLGALGVYAHRHPGDARAELLLAQTYVHRRWLSEGLDMYVDAYQKDPAARLDPRMARDLIFLGSTRTLHQDVLRHLQAWYRREEILPVFEEALAGDIDAGERERIEALRDAIH